MEIIECKHNIRCELGICKNRAAHTVKLDRTGPKSRINICDKCLNELYSAIGAVIVPKSIETGKRKRAAKDGNK